MVDAERSHTPYHAECHPFVAGSGCSCFNLGTVSISCRQVDSKVLSPRHQIAMTPLDLTRRAFLREAALLTVVNALPTSQAPNMFVQTVLARISHEEIG